MTDYRVYRLKAGERMWIAVIYMMMIAGIAVLFFDNVLVGIAGILGIPLVFRTVSRRKCRQIQRKLNIEFKEMLLSLAANMAAGYSMEKAGDGRGISGQIIYSGRVEGHNSGT